MQSARASSPSSAVVSPPWMKDSVTKMERELTAKYGPAQQARVSKGVQQVAEFWRAGDGDAAAFEEFVRNNFAGDQVTLDTLVQSLRILAGTTRRPHA